MFSYAVQNNYLQIELVTNFALNNCHAFLEAEHWVATMGVAGGGTGGSNPPHFLKWGGYSIICPPHFFELKYIKKY